MAGPIADYQVLMLIAALMGHAGLVTSEPKVAVLAWVISWIMLLMAAVAYYTF